MKLELNPVPTSDIDRGKAFYVDTAGFRLDHDVTSTEGVRVVQLTPPGSDGSIVLGHGLSGLEMPVGMLRGLHLVVDDVDATRRRLAAHGRATRRSPIAAVWQGGAAIGAGTAPGRGDASC